MTYPDISSVTWSAMTKITGLLMLHIVCVWLCVFFLCLLSPSVALQGWISSSNRGDEQAQTKPGNRSRRSDPGPVTWSCQLRWSALIAACLLAGFYGLQETARQDADVTQESAPAGVQLLERAGASRGAQHLWAPLLPAQGEEHTWEAISSFDWLIGFWGKEGFCYNPG